MEAIAAEARRLKIPVYVLEHGEVYESIYDEATHRFQKTGERINPRELAQRRFDLAPAQKDEIIDEFRRDFPFREIWKHLQDRTDVQLKRLVGLRETIHTSAATPKKIYA